jgi:MoaA/NifB/PqqE/SkfB family radical SAM enzyme
MTATITPRITQEGRTPLETVIPLATPYLVFLDPSDVCNARCSFCPTGTGEAWKHRVPQRMDWKLYKKIIDDLASMPDPIKTLRLYKDGEPMLNPRFASMVKYAKETGRFLQIDTTTNGSVLDKFTQDLGLDRIFISLPTDFYSTRDIWKARIRRFVRRNPTCHVHIKIIGDTLTPYQQEAFIKEFEMICDSLFVEHLAPCWPGYNVKANKDVGIYGQPIKEVQVCPYIFYSLAINSDGTVSLCFLDWRHHDIVGDLRVQSFSEVWNGSYLKDHRLIHLRKHRWVLPSCATCGQLSYGAPDNIDHYADQILRRII